MRSASGTTRGHWRSSGGATWIKGAEAELDGANPFPGEGYHAEQELLSEFPPHLYYVAPINNTWKWGVGVNAPFGLKLVYDPTFFGRYDSTVTDLKTYNIQSSLAYKVSDSLSVGGGVSSGMPRENILAMLEALAEFNAARAGRVTSA